MSKTKPAMLAQQLLPYMPRLITQPGKDRLKRWMRIKEQMLQRITEFEQELAELRALAEQM